jgi:molybdate transport system substrate-binding protein
LPERSHHASPPAAFVPPAARLLHLQSLANARGVRCIASGFWHCRLAAASLSAPFAEIAAQFSAAHPGVSVTFNFAGSQQLAQQLRQGAPCDLFASASQSYIDQVVQAGRISADAWRIFARNQLVVIYPLDRPLPDPSLAALAQPGLRLLLAAAEVPAGAYTRQFLDKAALDPAYGAAFRDGVLANVVSYEDNVSAVVAKVALGAADAGIVYTSDVAGANAAKFGQISIPPELNVTAVYRSLPARQLAARPGAGAAGFHPVARGQAILAQDGFLPPEP